MVGRSDHPRHEASASNAFAALHIRFLAVLMNKPVRAGGHDIGAAPRGGDSGAPRTKTPVHLTSAYECVRNPIERMIE
jgi:hypothetical protein